ncbi:MAG: DUF465 domain-containing protein [Caulobacterales bacterium]|nr:DUF465 domain-containing protein [Caulobacterales bacterium]
MTLFGRKKVMEGDQTMHGRLLALQNRHALLERRLAEEMARPRPDDVELKRIKVAKLNIKDEQAELWRRRRELNRRRWRGQWIDQRSYVGGTA